MLIEGKLIFFHSERFHGALEVNARRRALCDCQP